MKHLLLLVQSGYNPHHTLLQLLPIYQTGDLPAGSPAFSSIHIHVCHLLIHPHTCLAIFSSIHIHVCHLLFHPHTCLSPSRPSTLMSVTFSSFHIHVYLPTPHLLSGLSVRLPVSEPTSLPTGLSGYLSLSLPAARPLIDRPTRLSASRPAHSPCSRT